MRYLNEWSRASDPLALSISDKKLYVLRPDLYGGEGFLKKLKSLFLGKIDQKVYIKEQLLFGDSQPAIVISIDPIRIAAYTDELDCVAVLSFPKYIVDIYRLNVGSRLITINTYRSEPPINSDLIIGSKSSGRWYGFHPIIADFVSDDIQKIEKRKQSIDEEQWAYVLQLGMDYYRSKPDIFRNGRPVFSAIPKE